MKIQSLILTLILSVTSNSYADTVSDVMDNMSLEQKVGQLLLVGFKGFEVNDEIEEAVRDYHVGSVIYFDYDVTTRTRQRNISSPRQLKNLSADLQAIAEIPLFISVDEEGGKVSRLKSRYGFSSKPSPASLAKKSTRYTKKKAKSLARELSENGLNVNFAPLADVNTNPNNPVIGSLDRSFSSDPYKVEKYCRAFMDGQASQGVISVLKHFPGHGSSRGDSHEGLVDVSDTWNEKELIPFRNLIKSDDAEMIMTAHIFNKNLDANYPATLSQKTIQGILRDQLGFEGVVISDDMNMGAIAQHYGLKESIGLALNAGVDILLFGNNLVYDRDIAAKAHGLIMDLIHEGKIDLSRVDKKVRRILELKEEYNLIVKEFK